MTDFKVADLINNAERKWKRELIVNTFGEEDASRILRIPLARELHSDFMVWSGEQSGEFSVRSAYKLLQTSDPRAYDLQNIYRDFYKRIWLLNLPTKMKVTIWKLSWNYMLTRVNMQHRKLVSNSVCPRCDIGAETMDHIFRKCPISVSVWSALEIPNILQDTDLEFIQWLIGILTRHSSSQSRLIGCALWAIWGDRNTRIHDKVSRSGQEIAAFVKNYIKELDGVESRKSKNWKEVEQWKHPPGQAAKINFDGAYDARLFQSASGIVVRNREGDVLLSCSEIHEEVPSAFAAEAIACKKATQIGIKMKGSDIIIEGDSLSVIKKCKTEKQDKSQIGAFIHDIQQATSRSKHLRFEHIPRSANGLAHMLATETLRTKEEIYLVEGVPRFAELQKVIDGEREPD
ncbi:hypothetical protein PVK06_000643 [Gossypium arboreum]|uniref:Reverse transcriptase n=1 Tax=Gossypium arboreum TaxID=29729 RepID=A0ABR0QZT0_GOSAR|nr:hypothetical protein PVK06_000643 [Gossypium arboreum]